MQFQYFGIRELIYCILLYLWKNDDWVFLVVKYTAMTNDGVIAVETPVEGLEFYVKNGNFSTLVLIFIITLFSFVSLMNMYIFS